MISITYQEDDDLEFLDLVGDVISGLIELHAPQELFIIYIDHWFDHKWLNFCGKGRVPFYSGFDKMDTALDLFCQDQIVFPPFNPKRVIDEEYFQKTMGGSYSQSTPKQSVRRWELVHSSKYLHRRVAQFSESAVFLWVSTNTRETKRGSVMAYATQSKVVTTWYASFKKDQSWKVFKTKGISQEHFDMLFPCQVV